MYQTALNQNQELDILMNLLKLSHSPTDHCGKGKRQYMWMRGGESNIVVCRSAWMLIYNVSENRMSNISKKGEYYEAVTWVLKSACLSVRMSVLSVRMSVSVCHLSVCHSICVLFVCLSLVCRSVRPSICLTVRRAHHYTVSQCLSV